MILVICHPVLGRIKLREIEDVNHGFKEINRFLKINHIETVGTEVTDCKTATLVSLYVGEYAYTKLNGFSISRDYRQKHELYQISFEIYYLSKEEFLEEMLERTNGYKLYNQITVKEFDDVVNFTLPDLMPINSEECKRPSGEFMYEGPTVYLPYGQATKGNYRKCADLMWTYPSGYEDIKRYLTHLNIN